MDGQTFAGRQMQRPQRSESGSVPISPAGSAPGGNWAWMVDFNSHRMPPERPFQERITARIVSTMAGQGLATGGSEAEQNRSERPLSHTCVTLRLDVANATLNKVRKHSDFGQMAIDNWVPGNAAGRHHRTQPQGAARNHPGAEMRGSVSPQGTRRVPGANLSSPR